MWFKLWYDSLFSFLLQILGGRSLMKKTIPEALSILRGYSVLNKNEFIKFNERKTRLCTLQRRLTTLHSLQLWCYNITDHAESAFTCTMQPLSNTFWIFFQELLVILFLVIMVISFQPKIKIMTKVTVLWLSKEPGGTSAVITLTWMDFTIMGSTHLMPMESTGITGWDITTPPRELRWKLDQFHFRTFYFVSSSTLFILNCFFINHNSLKRSYRDNENDSVL